MCILGVLIITTTLSLCYNNYILYYYMEQIQGILVANVCIRCSLSAGGPYSLPKLPCFPLFPQLFFLCTLFKISGYHLPLPSTSPSKKIIIFYRGLLATAFPKIGLIVPLFLRYFPLFPFSSQPLGDPHIITGSLFSFLSACVSC